MRATVFFSLTKDSQWTKKGQKEISPKHFLYELSLKKSLIKNHNMEQTQLHIVHRFLCLKTMCCTHTEHNTLNILNSYNTHHFKNLSLPQVKKIIRKVATFRSSRFKRDIYLKSPT